MLYSVLKGGHDFTSVEIQALEQVQREFNAMGAETREKTERQATTDRDSFTNNPAFPLIQKFEPIFRTKLPKGRPMHGVHEMELVPGHGAIFRQQWRLSPEQTNTLKEWLKEMLEAGLIRPSISPHGAPTFCFKKPAGWPVPMGLSNASATFNRIVTSIFKDMNECVATYFDDIYVFTKDENIEVHLAAVERVFQRCFDRRLYLKLAKSTICSREIPCLGDFVGMEGVRIDVDKVAVINEWPVSRTVKDLQSVLGTTVYVQRFCDHYAELSAPRFNLVKSKAKVLVWTSMAQSAFDALKQALCKTPVLVLPDFSRPFRIRTDASQFAIGGVLYQSECSSEEVEGKKNAPIEHPIAFTGRKLAPADLNYPTHEQEMLAIIHCLNIWRVWYDQLADYQLKVSYIPGETNTVADTLSRRSDFEVDFLALKTKQMYGIKKLRPKSLIELIRRAQISHNAVRESLMKNKKPAVAHAERFRYSESDDLVYYDHNGVSRILIPGDNKEVQTQSYGSFMIVQLVATRVSRRPRELFRNNSSGKNMHKRITHYVKTCPTNQRSKGRTGKAPGLLRPLETPTGRWTSIGMVFVSGLPVNEDGKDAVLVIVDRLNKRCAKLTGTKLRMSAAYQQRTDGQVERINAILATYLWSYVGGYKNSWASYLALAEFAYNWHYQDSIQMTPFFADFEYNPALPINLDVRASQTSESKPATTFLLHMEHILRELQAKITSSAEKMKL
ncbi:unnamed protein product [Phytophthora fragariaefolia]|uniref:Unnamed protein product n=1 Tax=Phytophthora fragariaefolia TaxID=1490495 RepID=A0A9W6Y5F1_9STRA|nr:unnamed protein product [Phytophthora fragariaefolia]